MATPYLPTIQAYVAANFTDAMNYSAGFRTDFSIWLDTYVIPIVDITKPQEEYTVEIAACIKANSPNNYYRAVGAFKLKLYEACEYTVNLVINANTSEIVPAGTKVYSIVTTQTGTAAPTLIHTYSNTLGAVVMTRSATGTTVFTLTGAFPDMLKIQFKLAKMSADKVCTYDVQWVDANSIRLLTYKQVIDFIGATATQTLSDDLLLGSFIDIYVYA